MQKLVLLSYRFALYGMTINHLSSSTINSSLNCGINEKKIPDMKAGIVPNYNDGVSPIEKKLTPMPTPISVGIMLKCRFKNLNESIESKGMYSYLL